MIKRFFIIIAVKLRKFFSEIFYIQKGIQKGIQEGIQEGKELKTKEIVNSLLQDGMGIEKIAELLKISREHVLELAGMKMSKYDGL